MDQAGSVHSTPPINTSANPQGLAQQQREREKALKKVARLRAKAADEIERLIAFLDACDPYAATEQEDQADDGPCDDSELEASLGSPDRAVDQTGWGRMVTAVPTDSDAELDTSDDEPSLGSPEGTRIDFDTADGQQNWGQGNSFGLEGEHDGREPDDDDDRDSGCADIEGVLEQYAGTSAAGYGRHVE
jgi:hypothetical protein